MNDSLPRRGESLVRLGVFSGTQDSKTARAAQRGTMGILGVVRRPSWPAVAVPSVAVAAVCRGEGLEERQGSVPGVAPPVAWVFGLVS